MALGNARQTHLQVVHTIRAPFGYADPALTAGKRVGAIPKNCRVLSAVLVVETAFNAGTTNPISAGITALGTDFFNAAAGQTVAINAATLTVPMSTVASSADQDIYVSYVPTGTAATTGQATLVVTYVPDQA